MRPDQHNEPSHPWSWRLLLDAGMALTFLGVGLLLTLYMLALLIPRIVELTQGKTLDPASALASAVMLILALVLAYQGAVSVRRVWDTIKDNSDHEL